MKKILLAGLAMVCLLAQPVSATTINWTDWQSASTGAVAGSIGGVSVNYTGSYAFAQLGTGTNYWTEPNPGSKPYTGNTVIDNAPTPAEMIALNVPGSHKITFSQALLNPVMAIVSMGQPNWPVSYSFDQSFSLLSNGVGYWSGANGWQPGSYTIVGNTLTGREMHSAIQFNGLVESIAWTSTPNEYWHGVTVGSLASVPEPATMLLFGTGLAGLIGTSLRRRKEA